MTTENISLFQAVGAKMNYLQERQKVISQNVSNANTPNYAPKDLSKVDFGATLENVTKERSGVKAVKLTATNPNHIGFQQDELAGAKVRKDKLITEIAPNKNGVVLEEQMMKASETQMNFGLLANIYTSNMSMIRTSIGRRN